MCHLKNVTSTERREALHDDDSLQVYHVLQSFAAHPSHLCFSCHTPFLSPWGYAMLVFVKLAYFIHCDNLQLHILSCKWHDFIFHYGWLKLNAHFFHQLIYWRAPTMATVTAAATNVGRARVSSGSVPIPSSGILWAYRSFAWSGFLFPNHHSAFVILFYYLIYTVVIQSEVNELLQDNRLFRHWYKQSFFWAKPSHSTGRDEITSTTRVKRQLREWKTHWLAVVHRGLIFNSGKSNKMANK